MLETVDDGDDFEMSVTDALKVKATSSHQYNVVTNITEYTGQYFSFFMQSWNTDKLRDIV